MVRHDSFTGSASLGVVLVAGDPAGLADLHREEQGRVPVGCDGARLRSAGGLGARGFQTTGVVLVSGQVAVVVAFAGQLTAAGIGEG